MYKENYYYHSEQSEHALDDFGELRFTWDVIPYIQILVQLGRYLIRNCHLICSTFLVQILYCHIYKDEIDSQYPLKTCKNNFTILLSFLAKTLANEDNNGINSRTIIIENIVCMQVGIRRVIG